jgi:hypothetical protein
MSRFNLRHKYPAACLHAAGLDLSSTETLLLSLSIIADVKISNSPWGNFQSAPITSELCHLKGAVVSWMIQKASTRFPHPSGMLVPIKHWVLHYPNR